MAYRIRVNNTTKILEVDVEGDVTVAQASELYNKLLREAKQTNKHAGLVLITIFNHDGLRGNALHIIRSSLQKVRTVGIRKAAMVIPNWQGRPKSWFFSNREEALSQLLN